MWEIALNLLKNNGKSLLAVIALTGGGVWLGTFITRSQLSDQALAFSEEKSRLNREFSVRESRWDQARVAAANQYAADLKSALAAQLAWQRKADELSQSLAKQDKAHWQTVKNLKKRLKDAIERDGTAYTGIGPASLQLWREALGYPGTESLTGNSLSETTGIHAGNTGYAASPGGRLSPAGIVRFSSEYGRWCLVLRDRLQAIKDYYR